MSKPKGKKAAAPQADMTEFYLGALDQSQNIILLCDRNLVITYANSTAQKTLVALEGEIKKVLPQFSVWSEPASTTSMPILANNAGSSQTRPTCRTRQTLKSDP